MKKILIIRTDIDEKKSSRAFTGVDSALTMELYRKYACGNHSCRLKISANHYYSKYTLIDEKCNYIGTSDSMEELYKAQTKRYLHSEPYLGNVLILTHEQWLDKQLPMWKEVERYQYW
tara:strand:+ start:1453 stop:1806 length:354 start_codon:yes stop_codon:yes gene_type:complete